jgi:hypothetical protein
LSTYFLRKAVFYILTRGSYSLDSGFVNFDYQVRGQAAVGAAENKSFIYVEDQGILQEGVLVRK